MDEIVTVLTDIHQIDLGYGMLRLPVCFHQYSQLSTAMVPVFRHKHNGVLIDHTTFIIYYTHVNNLNPVCGNDSEILVFRKSRAGGCLLNLRGRDVHMAKAAITLYVKLYSIRNPLLTIQCQAASR